MFMSIKDRFMKIQGLLIVIPQMTAAAQMNPIRIQTPIQLQALIKALKIGGSRL